MPNVRFSLIADLTPVSVRFMTVADIVHILARLKSLLKKAVRMKMSAANNSVPGHCS